jgi:hypothetical protein
MKKVGIITFHSTTNFGASLQCYALFSLIKSYNFDVEIIDYQPSKLVWEYRKYQYLSSKSLVNKNIVTNLIKTFKNRKFMSSNTKTNGRTCATLEELKSFCNDYDAVICGSDEIWNFNSSFIGFDKAYFLGFVENSQSKKISYAASFGEIQHLGEYKEEVCKLLHKFNAISVRDTNSLNLVNSCDVYAQKVLDPTFLIKYENVIDDPEYLGEYILVYGSLSREEGDYVQSVARKTGLPIISIGQNWKYSPTRNLVGISPARWLGYFSKATYIFTNFYHGTIFSIIFRKPFMVFVKADKKIKVVDLLTSLDLTERMIQKGNLSDPDAFCAEIEFPEAILQGMIRDSQQYLLKALQVSS